MRTALTPAQGLSITLIRTFDGDVMAREYHADGSFTDHDILHSDLAVTITDTDAWIYSNSQGTVIDHSPSTLGTDSIGTHLT